MTNNQMKLIKKKLDKWLEAKGGAVEERESKCAAWLRYFDGLKVPVLQLAACTWLCSGAVILPEDLPKVEQAVKVAEINRVDPLQFDRPMAVFEAFPSTELKEAPIDPDTVPTLHLAKRFDSGLAIYDVDESQESRENMRKIINTHFGKDSSPWCLLQGDGKGNLTGGSLQYWNRYKAYPKQVAFVDGKLAAFSANSVNRKVWWDRMDESHEDIVVPGRVKGDSLGRSASCCFNPRTGDVRYEDIIRRRDDVIVERYADIEDRDYTLDILVDPKKKKKITSVVIPDGVTEIGKEAFEDCSSLHKVHIPDGVTRIGMGAFYGCSSLQEIYIPDSVKGIGVWAFNYCTSLQEIHIPDSVTEIGGEAFAGCSSLQEVRIPDGVTQIGRLAFKSCTSLKEVHIPDSVKEIGGWAFADCTSLKEVHIPNSVTGIGDGAFKCCTSLKEIHIPDSVKGIGDGAFKCCTSLQEIHIPDSVTEIGRRAFADCTSLQEIYIPDGVTQIGNLAFESCTSLKEVHIPDSVKKIGDRSFADCTSLKEVHLPNSLEVIGDAAFWDCTSLEVHVSATAPQALIDSLRVVVPSGCTVLRDLPEKDRSKKNVALKNKGVSM